MRTDRELIIAWQDDKDIKARDELVMRYYPAVISTTRHYPTPHGLHRDDLIQTGVVAVTEAIDKVDRERSNCFWTYAVLCVKSALSLEMLKRTGVNFKNGSPAIRKQAIEGRIGEVAHYDEAFDQRVTENFVDQADVDIMLSRMREAIRETCSPVEAVALRYYHSDLQDKEKVRGDLYINKVLRAYNTGLKKLKERML